MCGRVLLVFVGCVFGLAGRSSGFLATSLNISDPDVVEIFCTSQEIEGYKDHEWITKEGIRRNIREFFLLYPPSDNPDLSLPEDASLSELFHRYYGTTASPTRFIKAVNSIATANINSDSSQQLRYDPALHTDGEMLADTQKVLTSRYPQILSSILIQESYSAARSLLGSSLHSIQDFYSHSTWIEKGNSDILAGLGLPGYDLGTLAGPEETVCTPCPDSQGTCKDNVKVYSGLSTGYYTYDTNMGGDYLVPKPLSGGKCSHGGMLDDSSEKPAQGGINKDTPYPCFSPHHYLHEQAAELAVQATKHYMDQVLTAVGFDKYRRLFDLYLGSALSISIDTTGSMGDDIDAVKKQVEEIVANSSPELYILSQFNDPECGPVYKTTDGEKFLEAVRALRASGGGDHPELFWCGLQLALGETPDYGDVFCFTDATGKDGEKMDGLISQAQRQNNKVTVILSDLLRGTSNSTATKQQQNKGKGKGKVRHELDKNLVTTIDDYKRLSDSTGGLLISAAKFDVSDIVGIMGSGVETSTVTVLQQVVADTESITFPVDDTLEDFELRLSGQIIESSLSDSKGTTYNLMNQTALVEAGVEVVTFTQHFRALRWSEPLRGDWTLDLYPVYNVTATVLATSSLDFLSTFAVLDATPPHPHFRPTEGQPLTSTAYYVEVTLVGHRESNVAIVSGVQFIDKSGTVLRDINYPPPVKDQAYLWTSPLPNQAFFIRVLGYLSSGKKWIRQMPVEVRPVETLVELFSTTDELAAPPGGNTTAEFVVVNYGLESYFDITATDELEFLVDIVPKRVFLGNNNTAIVETMFLVPVTAEHGQISTVLVTARSETQTSSYNTALAHFYVLPAEIDSKPPTCFLNKMPNCTGFTNNGVCSTKTWNVTATLRDSGSGLYTVSSVPEGDNVTVTNLEPGTTEEVTLRYASDCCTTQVMIRGTDGQGNVGSCDKIDMGVVGGIIYYFEVESVGHTWLAVRWNITKSSIPVSHFDLVIDDKLLHQIPCHEESCVHYLSYLEPCSVHRMSVSPVFTYLGDMLQGFSATTQGITTEDEPKTPVHGREVDATETSITIAWEPANPACSFQYEVCIYEVNTEPEAASCKITSDTFMTTRGLMECHAYISDVRALSHNLNASTPLTFYSVTICTDFP